MKVVIIEDEPLTAQDLAESIVKTGTGVEIIAILSSVKEAITFFKNNNGADLVFSDIQLGDGLSFKIFDAVKIDAPIIFCTAYNEYALDAFKAAGINYILKPFTALAISAALEKYTRLKNSFTKNSMPYQDFGKALESAQRQKQQAILVFYKDKILPVKMDDIALLFLKNELVHLVTFNKQQYFINESLEEIEKIVQSEFYRVNRQYLVNKKAIKDVSKYFGRKLLLNLNVAFPEKITVSKLRVPEFLIWLTGAKA